jgi:Do/DeqQ family serine protease
MSRGLGRVGVLALCLCVTAAAAQEVPPSRQAIQLSFAPVVKTAAPAVVNVFTSRVVQQQNLSPLFADPFFRQFFGDRLGGVPQKRVQNALGSGVLVSPDGVIVTNYHVVKDSDEIRIVLTDRREFPATILRKDERADLAVLKIEGGGTLPYLALRDSDQLEVGDLVLAIGNPFGVGQTVTSGIVSAVARTTAGSGDYRYFIQTDAAINPGNSGGALITLDGKLAGINSAIYSQSGGSIGIGFAIPSNMVRTVIDASGKTIVRPWLGATGQPVTPDIAASIGLARPAGVLIKDIYPGGPADRAGLRLGEVVSAVNGREVDDSEGLRFRIATLALGGTARLAVHGKDGERSMAVSLEAPPETPPRDLRELAGREPLAGAVVGNLSPAFAEELGFDGQPRGVIVTEVRRGSAAGNIGIQPGDLVAQINGSEVIDTKQLESLLTGARTWRIAIKRGGETLTVSING